MNENYLLDLNINMASMGPRLFSRGNFLNARVWGPENWLQWGHGYSAVETGVSVSVDDVVKTGFNGATAIQPWKLID